MSSGYCNICNSWNRGGRANSFNFEFNDDGSTPSNSSSSSSRAVIFLLQNLLQIPKDLLTSFLGDSGGRHPSEWGLCLCSSCSDKVNQAATLFSQIQALTQEYEGIGRSLRSVAIKKEETKVDLVQRSTARSRSRTKSVLGSIWPNIIQHLRINEFISPLNKPDSVREVKVEVSSRQKKKVANYSHNPPDQEIEEFSEEDEEEQDDFEQEEEFKFDPGFDKKSQDPPSKRSTSKPRPKGRSRSTTRAIKKKKVLSEWQKNHPFKCRSCDQNCISEAALQAHILRKHQGVQHPIQCELCPKRFSNFCKVLLHIDRSHKAEIRNSAEEKELEFDSIFTTESIKRNRANVVTFTCVPCQTSFDSRITAELHFKRLHTGPSSKFTCSTCSAIFLSPAGLTNHNRTVHALSLPPEEAHPCSHCPKRFNSLHALKNHRNRRHRAAVGLTPYICQLCDKVTTSATSLKAHIASQHTKEFPFKCPTCGKGFVLQTQLSRHIRVIHEGLKAHKCPTCGKCFGVPGYLRLHMRTHTGEKPYPCSVSGCDKRFSRLAGLKLHVASHETEKKCICPVESCGMAFKLEISLKAHEINVHDKTGLLGLGCPFPGCRKRYATSSHLKQHEKSHTKLRRDVFPHPCPLCGIRFKSELDARNHCSKRIAESDENVKKEIS